MNTYYQNINNIDTQHMNNVVRECYRFIVDNKDKKLQLINSKSKLQGLLLVYTLDKEYVFKFGFSQPADEVYKKLERFCNNSIQSSKVPEDEKGTCIVCMENVMGHDILKLMNGLEDGGVHCSHCVALYCMDCYHTYCNMMKPCCYCNQHFMRTLVNNEKKIKKLNKKRKKNKVTKGCSA